MDPAQFEDASTDDTSFDKDAQIKKKVFHHLNLTFLIKTKKLGYVYNFFFNFRLKFK